MLLYFSLAVNPVDSRESSFCLCTMKLCVDVNIRRQI
jgi:hypothetical protein